MFVTFEGGEGSGKSTQVAMLVERLQSSGRESIATREPGGSATSEQIRDLILQDSSVGMSPRCESLLFAAARAEHVASVIRPALARGVVVVSDRFVDSSIAYQGVGRGLGHSDVAEISSWATDGLEPDLTVVLDLDPVVGLGRAQDPNRLEAEGLSFHCAVRETFLGLAQSNPDTHVVVPADRHPDSVSVDVWLAVEATLDRGDSDSRRQGRETAVPAPFTSMAPRTSGRPASAAADNSPPNPASKRPTSGSVTTTLPSAESRRSW